MNKPDHPAMAAEEKRALLARLLADRTPQQASTRFPLSFAQQRVWFIEQLHGGRSVYSIPAAIRLRGSLDAGRLRRCVDIIVARHESLRTRFVSQDGTPVQVVEPEGRIRLDTAFLGEGEEIGERLRTIVEQPFSLEEGPLVRFSLLATGPDDHVLLIVIHHLVADYSSLQIMLGELAGLYNGAGEPDGRSLPKLPIQYADYCAWQRQNEARLVPKLDYWRAQLADAPGLIELPADFPRPAVQSFNGARHWFTLDPAVASGIRATARRYGTTHFTVLLAAFQLLLNRYSGSDDICVGTSVSNRSRPELEKLVGFFANTLVMRTKCEPADTFETLLARVHATVLDGLANQEVPFEQVVEAMAAERSLSHNALFQTMFTLHDRQDYRSAIKGLDLFRVEFSKATSRFDLSIDLFEEEGFSGVLEYNPDLFRRSTVERMEGHFQRLLDAVLKEPGRALAGIDILSASEREALDARNRTGTAIPAGDIATLLETVAARRGQAGALRFAGTTLSHDELNAAANRLAAHIRNRLPGGGHNPRVAICLPRSGELVIAILAVLKLGAAYVPLDPTFPPVRLKAILDDSGAALAIVGNAGESIPEVIADMPCPWIDLHEDAAVIAAAPAGNPPRDVAGDDLAYVMFTSGSTGRPKGVPVRRESLMNLLASMASRPGMGPDDRLVAVTTPAFDIATLELLLPLMAGGCVVVAGQHVVHNGYALAALVAESGATVMQATPTTWRLLSDCGWKAPPGFRMFCGGEALDVALARTLLGGEGELWNLYGPTETTIWSACCRIEAAHVERSVIPLGEPVFNTELHVLDRHMKPVPAGVAGELYIGGAGLSPGYLDRPDLTATAFVDNPFPRKSGMPVSPRLYRSGDIVKRLDSGELVYLGRRDFQVKLRGFRIELSEIESVLAEAEEIEQAVVIVRKDRRGGDGAIIAYCRTAAATAPDMEGRLRAALPARLPAYMIPAAFVFLTAFPVNANGKIDRNRLPVPEPAADAGTGEPPATATERAIAGIWREILDLPAVTRDDHFFERGGHSLLAMRVIARLPPAAGKADALRKLFEHPRLRDFAAALDSDPAAAGETGEAVIARIPRDGRLALSFAQQRLWALTQLEPDSPAYNLPVAVRLRGPLDLLRLQQALGQLCDRQESLRSRIVTEDGRGRIEILANVEPDLVVRAIGEAGLDSTIAAECALPFDLEKAPLFRVRLFSPGADEHVLLIVLHHIVADALSVQLMLRELAQFYSEPGGAPPPSASSGLPIQYADYAAWQQQQDFDARLDYWRGLLADAPPLLDLPTDFPRPARQDFRGDSVHFELGADLARGISTLAATTDASPYMVVLSAFAMMLGRYSGMPDVVIGTPVSQRIHPDLEKVVGLFVNTLALRLDCDTGGSFLDHLARTRARVIDGFAHQDVPFERVVDALSVSRSWSHNPVFQAMFVWQTRDNAPVADPGNLDWEPVALPHGSAKVDITLEVRHAPGGMTCRLEYRTDLFRRETVSMMADVLTTLLEAAVAAPARPVALLSLLPETQRQRIAAWNATGKAYPASPATLHGFFETSVARQPDAAAASDRHHGISYGELDRRANALAHHLVSLGIGRGACVGICMPRNIDLICAMLAVLKAGAAYVPLDPGYPEDRIAYIASDAGLALLLTADFRADFRGLPLLDPTGVWGGSFDGGSTEQAAATEPPVCHARGGDLAYIIYTSGSTGKPKGVAIEHRNAVAFARWCLDVFTPAQMKGMLASTSICFDLSVFEIFVTFASGGEVFIVDDLFDLPDARFSDRITLINTVPTPMTELLRFGPLPENARTVCLAGEPLPPSLARQIYATGSVDALYNLYGPSEDTTYSTGTLVPRPGDRIDIGRPIANTQAYVLDDGMQQVPIGMPGELYLAGQGIARGYRNRPDLTAERFLPNPFGAGRDAPVLYRTGDRVRWLPDGNLDYLGRADRQMKISGFRIEPGEVEAALLRYPGVSGAAVDAWRDQTGYVRLAAWVETGASLSKAALADYLGKQLPRHLVPALFGILDRLPRLPNGKLDRKALPDPSGTSETEAANALPRPGFEQRLAAIWSALLGRSDIGRDDNFFSLGGDSILAIQVVARARQEGIAIAPRDLFQYATLAALAASVTGMAPAATARLPVTGEVSLSPAQHWFFEQDLPQVHHWNQAVLLRPVRRLEAERLQQVLDILHASHDALRARFERQAGGWRQVYGAVAGGPRLRTMSCEPQDARSSIAEAGTALQSSFDITAGPVWGALLVDIDGGEQRLAIAAHHLVIDGISWRTLLDDMATCYAALEAGDAPPQSLLRSSPVGEWVAALAEAPVFDAEAAFWSDICEACVAPLPVDDPAGGNLAGDAGVVELTIDRETTRRLLRDVPANYPVRVDEVMLAALFLAVRAWTGEDRLRLILESHGRQDLFGNIDLSRTLGWFTALYPVLLDCTGARDTRSILLSVKEQLRAIEHDGIAFGVLKHLRKHPLPRLEDIARLRFNYLGQTDNLFAGDSLFAPAAETAGEVHGRANPRGVLLDVNCIVSGGSLRVRWSYSCALFRRETIEALSNDFHRHLAELIDFSLTSDGAGYTPSDFPHMNFDQDDLERILRTL